MFKCNKLPQILNTYLDEINKTLQDNLTDLSLKNHLNYKKGSEFIFKLVKSLANRND